IWQTASYAGSLMLRPVFDNYPNPTVSVNELDKKDTFNVYPNPAHTTINIKINNSNSYHINLIDINGKVMIDTESSLTTKINTSSIANGIYILRFTNNNTQQITHKKVVISK
ncbi:MAG: T9SS type A sorting domain-containing protein, partial [Vicingaceae bacterium]|nr:T9SS type A sorting domain-containing protein [Vicingaceae bacterium]